MKIESSDKHEELKALLAQSFRSEEGDDVPSLPEDLRDETILRKPIQMSRLIEILSACRAGA